MRYRVRVSLSSAPAPADHTHEQGAQPKRVEHDGPADAGDIPGVAAQLKRLQANAGNQAVNRLLRRFTTDRTAIARMPLVQRDDPQAQQSFATKPPPDFSKLTWPQLLPTAHGAGGASITKIDLHTPGNGIKGPGTGAAPTFTYKDAKDIRTDPATGTPQGGVGGTALADAQAAVDAAALKAAGDAAVQQIVGGRSRIPDRPMKRSANNNAGYDYNPDTDPTAKDYNTWSKSALPTGVQATDWNWQVFKKIQDLEGQEGRLTTFDKTLTVGPGYSTSAGQGQQVLAKTFDALPEVKAAAFAAGLTADSSGGMTGRGHGQEVGPDWPGCGGVRAGHTVFAVAHCQYQPGHAAHCRRRSRGGPERADKTAPDVSGCRMAAIPRRLFERCEQSGQGLAA